MKQSWLPPALCLVLSLLVGSLVQWGFLKYTLREGDKRANQLTGSALGRLLNHGHRLNDDLILQEGIQGLASAPDILFACVLDTHRNVLVHTQASQLGHPFQFPRGLPADKTLWVQTLRDGKTPWGSLVFGVSNLTLHRLLAQQIMHSLVLNVAVILCFGVLTISFLRKETRLHQEKDTIQFQCDDFTRTIKQLREEWESCHRAWECRMAGALGRISQPILLLDQTQRIVSANDQARKRLGVLAQEIAGRPWQDVPLLAECGQVLQQSLENPGHVIERSQPGGTIQFHSESQAGVLSTWIIWI